MYRRIVALDKPVPVAICPDCYPTASGGVSRNSVRKVSEVSLRAEGEIRDRRASKLDTYSDHIDTPPIRGSGQLRDVAA